MRTISAADDALLVSPTRSDHVRVSIKDSLGAWVDLSDLYGFDWVYTVDVSDTVDNPTMTAEITLLRENEKLSLAPFVESSVLNNLQGSYVPLIDIARQIKVEVAVGASESGPVAWQNFFEGYVDVVDSGGNDSDLKLSCRDLGAALIDKFIENQTVYSTTSGTAVQTVMQSILTDNGTGVTLYVPISPGWNIRRYQQQKEPVLDALRKLAHQIGWECRYRWDSGTSAWRLTLYEPDRAKSVADRTFGPSEYWELSRAEISTENIRNKVRVIYTDNATGARLRSEASDATSVARYGTRFMEIAESASSNIDSSTEANKMRDAALSDLKDPDLGQSVTQPAFWPIEVGDLYTYEANGVHYDTNQTHAVVGWSARWGDGFAGMSIQLQGEVSGGYLRWIGSEARAGNAPSADEQGPLRKNEITRYSSLFGIGSYHLDAAAERNTLLPNADFGWQSRVTTGSGEPPDSWVMQNGTWGPTSDVYVNTTLQQTGGRSLHFRDTGTTPVRVKSEVVNPCTEGDLYLGSALLYSTSTDSSDAHRIYVTWYQADGTTVISTSNIYNARVSGSAWTQIPMTYVQAPSNARWYSMHIEKITSTNHHLYVDSIRLTRGLAGFAAVGGSGDNPVTPQNTTTKVLMPVEGWDYGGGYDTTTSEYSVIYPGLYHFIGIIQLDNVRVNTLIQALIQKQNLGAGAWVAAGYANAMYNVSTGNDPWVIAPSAIAVANPTDKFRLTVWHNEAPNLQLLAGAFSGQQINHL